MPANVLPEMDDPRMKSLGKQLNRSRKSSIISHEKLKSELTVYEKSLDKEMKSIDGKYQKNGLRLKTKLARVRGTQKCLKYKREQTFVEDSDEYPYGIYEGESLNSYRRQIDNLIERRHPKYRRQKKVDQYMRTDKIMGRIIDDGDAKMQFEFIMNKDNQDNESLNSYMQRENPLSLTFVAAAKNGPNHSSWKSPNAPVINPKSKVKDWLKPSDFSRTVQNEHTDSVRESTSRERPQSRALTSAESSADALPDFATVRSSPSKINLPPIIAKKEFVKRRSGPLSKGMSLPNLSIRRATKCETLSSGNVQKLANLKGRRMTTFI